eukprot:SAG22_NODE_12561_length_438_cov_0.758112_1_plen_64_part_10
MPSFRSDTFGTTYPVQVLAQKAAAAAHAKLSAEEQALAVKAAAAAAAAALADQALPPIKFGAAV